MKEIEQRNSSGEIIANVSYELDDLSRVQTETKDGRVRSIEYDSTDQVKTVTGSNSEGYTYDKNGNRTNAGYVTGAGNQLKSDGTYTYDYDAEGNRTKRTKISDRSVDIYTWDYRNRLASITSQDAAGIVTQVVGYEYDVDDQRVKKTVTSASLSAGDGVVENYYLDGEQIAFVTDGGGNETFHYLYGTNVDQVLAQDSSTGMLWALADRLGSVDTLTDAHGVVVDKRTFDSFGRLLSETNPSVSFRYGYTGRELDLESGLDYYRARYYDSNVGRFISVDPMGFGAGDTNLYRYVSNNSTNATDPSGKFAFLLPAIPAGISAASWLIGGAIVAIGTIGTAITINNNAGVIGDAVRSGSENLGRTFNDSITSASAFGNGLKDSLVTNTNAFGRTLNDSVSAGTKAFNNAVDFWGSNLSTRRFSNPDFQIPTFTPPFPNSEPFDWSKYVETYTGTPDAISPLGGFVLDNGFRNPLHTGHTPEDNSWLSPQFLQIVPRLPPQVPTGPISVDEALRLAQEFLDPGIGGRFEVDKPNSSGVQYIQDEYIDDYGRKVVKRIGFDFNPNNKHVRETGFQHLNLQTQFGKPDGKTKPASDGNPYHDPHIPVDNKDIKPGDYKTPQKK